MDRLSAQVLGWFMDQYLGFYDIVHLAATCKHAYDVWKKLLSEHWRPQFPNFFTPFQVMVGVAVALHGEAKWQQLMPSSTVTPRHRLFFPMKEASFFGVDIVQTDGDVTATIRQTPSSVHGVAELRFSRAKNDTEFIVASSPWKESYWTFEHDLPVTTRQAQATCVKIAQSMLKNARTRVRYWQTRHLTDRLNAFKVHERINNKVFVCQMIPYIDTRTTIRATFKKTLIAANVMDREHVECVREIIETHSERLNDELFGNLAMEPIPYDLMELFHHDIRAYLMSQLPSEVSETHWWHEDVIPIHVLAKLHAANADRARLAVSIWPIWITWNTMYGSVVTYPHDMRHLYTIVDLHFSIYLKWGHLTVDALRSLVEIYGFTRVFGDFIGSYTIFDRQSHLRSDGCGTLVEWCHDHAQSVDFFDLIDWNATTERFGGTHLTPMQFLIFIGICVARRGPKRRLATDGPVLKRRKVIGK